MSDAVKLYQPPSKLDEKSLKVAKKELNEKDAKQVAADIEYIKNWFAKETHIKAKMDDEFILTFLRASKFSYTKCQEKIENFWANRTSHPEMFSGRNFNDDSLLMEIADIGFICPLPFLDDEGRRIIIQVFIIYLTV
jgi:hypothetical protein